MQHSSAGSHLGVDESLRLPGELDSHHLVAVDLALEQEQQLLHPRSVHLAHLLLVCLLQHARYGFFVEVFQGQVFESERFVRSAVRICSAERIRNGVPVRRGASALSLQLQFPISAGQRRRAACRTAPCQSHLIICRRYLLPQRVPTAEHTTKD